VSTTYGMYEVTGRRPFRGHQPGETFEAQLGPGAEARAIRRGDIRLIERITVQVPAGSYAFPEGWPQGRTTTTTGGR